MSERLGLEAGEGVSMSRERLYPPDWLDTDTAAYMVSMSVDTFVRRVDDGTFPKPVVLGGKRLWHRGRLSDAVDWGCARHQACTGRCWSAARSCCEYATNFRRVSSSGSSALRPQVRERRHTSRTAPWPQPVAHCAVSSGGRPSVRTLNLSEWHGHGHGR